MDNKIPDNEKEACAKWFALENLGQIPGDRVKEILRFNRRKPKPRNFIDVIHTVYNEYFYEFERECGIDINPEYESWLSDVKQDDPYCVKEWIKVKEKFKD